MNSQVRKSVICCSTLETKSVPQQKKVYIFSKLRASVQVSVKVITLGFGKYDTTNTAIVSIIGLTINEPLIYRY